MKPYTIKKFDAYGVRTILSLFLPGRTSAVATATVEDAVVVNWSGLGDVHANDALLFADAVRDLVDEATEILKKMA